MGPGDREMRVWRGCAGLESQVESANLISVDFTIFATGFQGELSNWVLSSGPVRGVGESRGGLKKKT